MKQRGFAAAIGRHKADPVSLVKFQVKVVNDIFACAGIFKEYVFKIYDQAIMIIRIHNTLQKRKIPHEHAVFS